VAEIKVYYNPDSFTSFDPYKDDYEPDREKLECIGSIEAESINEAWALLQHTDSRTSPSPSIIQERRSASVGDVFETPEGYFVVKWVGFKKLDW
jgi:hypothetical protein